MKVSALRQVPVLSFLKDQDLKTLSEGVHEAHYANGQFIFKEGDPAECFHVLTKGAVKCMKTSQAGKEAVMKVLLPGDLFCCEAAVFDGKPHPGCAQPMGPVTLLKIPKRAYMKLLKTNPAAAIEVIKYLSGRLSEAQETSKTFALQRADQRLAVLLIKLAERAGKKIPQGILLDLELSRQDLADMTGLALETTIRTLSTFIRQGAVAKSGRRIILRDLHALNNVVENSA